MECQRLTLGQPEKGKCSPCCTISPQGWALIGLFGFHDEALVTLGEGSWGKDSGQRQLDGESCGQRGPSQNLLQAQRLCLPS